jgi:hypothetical protein
MSQSKKGSLIESLVNIVVGYVLSNIIWAVIAWYQDLDFTWQRNVGIVSIFTVASLIRSYTLRRLFNAKNKSDARTGAR